MKKMLIGVLALGMVALPGLAFADFNDVSLATTNTIISVGGFNLTVSGSNASIESIVVNANDFTVNLQAGSALTVSSSDLKDFGVSVTGSASKSTTCGGSASTLGLTSTGAGTAAITPTGTCSGGGGQSYTYGCTNPAATNYNPLANADNGTCTLPSSGGGGGATPATPARPAVPTVSPAIPATPATPPVKSPLSMATPNANAIANANANASFKRDVTLGSKGDDVKALQVWLNAHGYTIVSSGAGSPGKETNTFGGLTRAALIKFQKAKGINPASGYFGPKTRAALAQ